MSATNIVRALLETLLAFNACLNGARDAGFTIEVGSNDEQLITVIVTTPEGDRFMLEPKRKVN
jgi:hypothetical protein